MGDPHHLVAAMLVIYRYHNNLFQWVKWQYNLEGQLGNFSTANDALMKILGKHGALV